MSKLKQLIALIEQENMNEADYTVESWKTFKIALDNAKVLLDNVNATQEEVDLAYNELQIAKDALVKAIAGLQIVTTDSTVKTLANSGDTIASVKTGDESLAGMFATIALLSAVVYMVLRKKKIIKYNF